MPRMASLRKRFADLIPELAKFGVVGLIGAVVDLGGADYLHVHLGLGPMVAKGLSITAATVVTYLGSRFWTFRHRVNQALLRETVLFVALNAVGLVIAEVVIAATTYGLDLKSELAYNAASVVGTGLGTIFRYFSYKKWVFLAGAPGAAVAAGEAAVSGIVDPTETSPSGAMLAGDQGRDGPPREELERPAELRYGPAWEQLDPAESDGRHRLSAYPLYPLYLLYLLARPTLLSLQSHSAQS
jgi:putative flippase GtrA